MDLYEAIEVVEGVLQRIENGSDYRIVTEPGDYIYDAIKICLEAARDKAGV